jgi:hypothetical protein
MHSDDLSLPRPAKPCWLFMLSVDNTVSGQFPIFKTEAL